MFARFFLTLRQTGLPVSLTEYLSLLESLEQGVADYRVETFYYLSRAALVKDERHFDKFDRVFGHVFEGAEFFTEQFAEDPQSSIPKEQPERVENSNPMYIRRSAKITVSFRPTFR